MRKLSVELANDLQKMAEFSLHPVTLDKLVEKLSFVDDLDTFFKSLISETHPHYDGFTPKRQVELISQWYEGQRLIINALIVTLQSSVTVIADIDHTIAESIFKDIKEIQKVQNSKFGEDIVL